MSNKSNKTQDAQVKTEPVKPAPASAKRKLTGLDYYLMALEAEGVPFQQIASEIDTLVCRNR